MNKLISTLSILILLSGCVSTPKVFTDYDERRDFSGYKTFSWVHDPPMLQAGDYPVSPLAEKRMTNAIKEQLIKKGFTFVEQPQDADFTVVFTMGARDKIEIVRRSSGYYHHRVYWGWGYYYYPHFVYYPFDPGRYAYTEVPRTYTRGSIAIDIFDAKTEEPVWHSKASKRLTTRDLQSNAKNAPDIARRLLACFPPQPDEKPLMSPWESSTRAKQNSEIP